MRTCPDNTKNPSNRILLHDICVTKPQISKSDSLLGFHKVLSSCASTFRKQSKQYFQHATNINTPKCVLTFAKWAAIYCMGAVPFLWSQSLISPSCAVANRYLDKRFHRTWVAPAGRNKIHVRFLRKILISIDSITTLQPSDVNEVYILTYLKCQCML